MKNKRIFFYIFFPLLTILLLALDFFKVDPFYSFSQRASDFYFKFHKDRISDKVYLVVIDEKSVNHFGRWPWDRKIFAKGLSKLFQAKVVILDMVFSEKTNPSSDSFLAKTIEDMGNVVCGFFVRLKSTEKISEEIIDIMSDSALLRIPEVIPFETAQYIEPNILPITEACALVGIFTTKADKDNIFRHYPVGFIYKGDFYPSIGIQGLRMFLNEDAVITKKGNLYIGNRKVFVDKDTKMIPLNFYVYERYQERMIPFVDVYYGKIKPEFFKDKIVVVGISEAGVTDIRSTPIGQIPGPLLHFTFISNFLQDELLKCSKKLNALFVITAIALTVLIFRFIKSSYTRIVSYFVIGLMIIFCGLCLYKLFWWKVDIFFPILGVFVSGLAIESYVALIKTQQERFLKYAFGTYISDKLLEVITKHPEKLKLGGEKKEITVLFSDIRNFTSLSEKISPEALVEFLNSYLTPMTELILESEGTLDKYIGDAIMALWNAPLDVEDHPKKALLTAYKMIQKLKDINLQFKIKYGFEIDIGIGINTGPVVVGNMGSQKRFDYTAVGDTVNLASRLEGLNKVYKTKILFSEFTYEKVNFNGLPFLPVDIDLVRVKGKEQPVKIFTLLSANEESKKIKELYEKGIELYRKGEFKTALKIFNELDFSPAKVMAKRCEELLTNPPEKWDGVFTATSK